MPTDVAERARRVAADLDADALVSIGGGSATGTAKAVAMVRDVPIVAVPTTYAGSEATCVWGLTEGGVKSTGRDERVLPRVVVYDTALFVGIPTTLAVSSGLNAIAHAIDAMWAPRSDPITRALGGEGLRALAAGLPAVAEHPDLGGGHDDALYGAYLAAVAFDGAGSGLHHTICHVLGGMFDLPHADTHAVVIQHVLDANAPHAPDAARRIAGALGVIDASAGLRELRRRLAAPVALRDLGMPEGGVRSAVEPILAAAPPSNPAPVTSTSITTLLLAAWSGHE
ncbi:iron-containing alcohol dehydrogenase [Pseudonocardia dioxanivorans]|uniref:iron-containing alcohol dehydrogenase n=1 Tax=Pseudonocardia dioxanivorans TaxID=240495 RepID=UPI001F2631BB|nr:iron-containing alcohol dehydrogenase [Pseudonocardia dioxanivorans]